VARYRFATRKQRGIEKFFPGQSARNPLKRLDSGKQKKGKESKREEFQRFTGISQLS
jgi:hypothetical protein